MNRTKEVRSVFGNAQRTSYEYIKFLKEKYNTNFRILVVDDKDGLHSIPFANHNANVVMYEPNEIYINGGIMEIIIFYQLTIGNITQKIKIR